jgi:hypothetical protein
MRRLDKRTALGGYQGVAREAPGHLLRSVQFLPDINAIFTSFVLEL